MYIRTQTQKPQFASSAHICTHAHKHRNHNLPAVRWPSRLYVYVQVHIYIYIYTYTYHNRQPCASKHSDGLGDCTYTDMLVYTYIHVQIHCNLQSCASQLSANAIKQSRLLLSDVPLGDSARDPPL